MSVKKLYTVKDDKGQYWDFTGIEGGFWYLYNSDSPATSNKDLAFKVAKEHGGHVVTLIEEPEKVKLPREAAGWVATVKSSGRAITDLFDEFAMPEEVGDWLYGAIDDEVEHHEERGLMLVNAYQYGYTVEKEKRYRVLAPKSWWKDSDTPEYMWHGYDGLFHVNNSDTDDVETLFTQKQLEQYNLTSDLFKKEEVTDGL